MSTSVSLQLPPNGSLVITTSLVEKIERLEEENNRLKEENNRLKAQLERMQAPDAQIVAQPEHEPDRNVRRRLDQVRQLGLECTIRHVVAYCPCSGPPPP
jgi:regulator of replication initiation timing